MNRLVFVQLSRLSRTMQDVALIFDVIYHGTVFIEERFANNPRKADAVYSVARQRFDVNTPLPIGLPR